MNRELPARRAGVLLHPSSLPGEGSNGTLGAEARRFVDFLHSAGQGVWQVLPLCPTHGDLSPYQGLSSYAGNPCLIDYAEVAHWCDAGEGDTPLARAWCGFQRYANEGERQDFEHFKREADWLEDYVLFSVIREHHDQGGWWQWPAPLRDRESAALEEWQQQQAEALERGRFEQFLFFRQWHALKGYANERGIKLFGDLPIFVAHDSADVWAHPQVFRLDFEGLPLEVAGVPPDYFSETGQRWGNPLYDWDTLAAEDFDWWRRRLGYQLNLFDWLRIDHFRGFEACWVIPAEDKTAINGHWRKVPGDRLFAALQKEWGVLPLVAEDLGLITAEVTALRHRFHLPGMRVLQFAFDGTSNNPHLPHLHEGDSVVYTGTHDNDTTLGWFRGLDVVEKERVLNYLGGPVEAMPWPLIRAAYASTARLTCIPLQDLLALGSEARMNTPGTTEGNWRWRFSWSQLTDELAPHMRKLATIYGRT